MSAAIFFKPVSPDTRHRFVHGTSTSYQKLVTHFGHVLRPDKIPVLQAMALAADDDFYEEVAHQIALYGAIEISVEY